MSLKLVELQIALPRTQDVGKLQEQLQQKGQHLQEHLASTQQKQEEQKRKQVNKHEKASKNQLNKDGERRTSVQPPLQGSQRDKASQNMHSQHPYKGTTIDIEG